MRLEQPLFAGLRTCYKGRMKKQAEPKSSPFPDVFYPRRDIVCTDAFSRFLNEYHSNLDYFFFIIKLVANADQTRTVASKALLKVETDPDKRANYEARIANPDEATPQTLYRFVQGSYKRDRERFSTILLIDHQQRGAETPRNDIIIADGTGRRSSPFHTPEGLSSIHHRQKDQ